MALINQNSVIGVTSITSPGASNVLTVHTSDTTERLRITSNGLSFSGTNASLDTSGNLTVGGNVSVGGTLTYEDVTNIDAVGIITAQAGIRVTGGSVGIGTSVPSHTLDVVGNTQLYGTLVIGDNTDISPTANGAGQLHIDGNGYTPYIAADGTAMYVGHNSSARDLRFQTNETDRITIDGSTGNIGIGTDTTDRQLAIYHDTQATLELKSSNTGQSSLWFSDIDDGNIGGVYYTHNNDKMVLRVSDADRMTITGIGSVGISESSPDMKLELRESGVTISAAGNAISGSTMKGIHLANSNNDDTSLGIWATTGDAHWSGISFQRNDSANTWGTDLRFYTHEDGTNDLTYARERLRVNTNGLVINSKGQNAENTGGSILGRYKYNQINQSQNYEHKILGPDGRKLQDFCNNNVYAVITIITTGTGTMTMFCQYEYFAISSGQTVNLTHLRGNSVANSNRPYMVLDSYDPCWKMNHTGNYTMDIEVALYGGKSGYTYTPEFGQFTANP